MKKQFITLLLCLTLFVILGCSAKINIKPNSDLTHIRRVAVLPFGPNGTVSDMFTTELIGIGKFDVIERGQLDKVLDEYKLSLSGILDEKTRKKLGKLLGVDAFFMGSAQIYKFYSEFHGGTRYQTSINIRLIDIETGTILLSCSDSGHQYRSIKSIVKKINKAFK